MTDGAVDPTVGAAIIGLGYDRDFDEVPADSAARADAALRPVPGWRCIELDARDAGCCGPARRGPRPRRHGQGLRLRPRRGADRRGSPGRPSWSDLGGDVSVAGAPPEGWPVGHRARLRHVAFGLRRGRGPTPGRPRQFGDVGADLAPRRPPGAPHRRPEDRRQRRGPAGSSSRWRRRLAWWPTPPARRPSYGARRHRSGCRPWGSPAAWSVPTARSWRSTVGPRTTGRRRR